MLRVIHTGRRLPYADGHVYNYVPSRFGYCPLGTFGRAAPSVVMSLKFNPYHQWLAVPEGIQAPNHYELLGLRGETSVERERLAADYAAALELFRLTGGFTAVLDAGATVGNPDGVRAHLCLRTRALRPMLSEAASKPLSSSSHNQRTPPLLTARRGSPHPTAMTDSILMGACSFSTA